LKAPHCNENIIYVFPEKQLRGLSPKFHIHVSWSDLYIPRIGQHISCSRIDRPILEIYKTLTNKYEYRDWEREHYNSVLEKEAAQFHFWEYWEKSLLD
jgi:hypothetical protein